MGLVSEVESEGDEVKIKPIVATKKVVEVGLYLTAGQLRRLETLMVKWNVKMAVLPEPEPPYANLTEWYAECAEWYGS